VNNLVVAGAGSGKTTTIVGKVKYLLERYSYTPSELLVLSFTNASATEMAERIHKETGKEIDVMTFHKLGKEIIASVEGKQPAITGINMPRFIEEQFKTLCNTTQYQDLLNTYFISYQKQFQSAFEFKAQGDYLDYLKDKQIVTLNGKAVKSYEEMEIANFLYTHNIEFEYEKQYQYDTATRKHSQYKPDFYLHHYDIYIEHFGIDRNGNVPAFFTGRDGKSAKQAYNEGIRWKRELHEDNDTILIETYSYEMREGTLLLNLRKKLLEFAVNHTPMSGEELWKKLIDETPLNLNSFTFLIETFINHLKSNSYSLKELRLLNQQRHEGYHFRRNEIFIQIIEPIYASYVSKLQQDKEIDFNDMINRATEYIAQETLKTDYRYIIVDEFQDMSLPRYKLIKAIKDKNNTKLFCVGDDWQSIYRFAGSDITFFTSFESNFGYTEKSYIETTYRFPTDLIRLSSNFILKYPGQIKKNLRSINSSPDSAFELVYGTETSISKELKNCLDTLPKQHRSAPGQIPTGYRQL